MRLDNNVLLYRQRLPLEVKERMSVRRLEQFVDIYGDDVYVSFSGGKDSRVLLYLCRKYIDRNMPAVFLDTWMEYPALREYVYQFDNVTYIKPEKLPKQIIEECGWCFPSKDVAEAVYAYRKGQQWAINKLNGLDREGNPCKFRERYKKWLPLVDCPELISHRCCLEMKEFPVQKYERLTGKKPIVALMASESARRRESYLRTGCNSFDSERAICKPMGFWTEQDVLRYHCKNGIELAPPYGDIVAKGTAPLRCIPQRGCESCMLKTTGEQRTGCMFCPVGGHLDNFAKLERLKAVNPVLYDYCMEELGEKRLIEWVRRNILKREG